MRIKPESADVYLKYKCSKCDAVHIVERAETIFPGGVLCSCGCKLRFRPVKSIKVSLNYGLQPQMLDEAASAAQKLLKNYGFDRSEATGLVAKARKLTKTTDIGELVKASLQQVEVDA